MAECLQSHTSLIISIYLRIFLFNYEIGHIEVWNELRQDRCCNIVRVSENQVVYLLLFYDAVNFIEKPAAFAQSEL